MQASCLVGPVGSENWVGSCKELVNVFDQMCINVLGFEHAAQV